jgi:arabinofuranosyltransferase
MRLAVCALAGFAALMARVLSGAHPIDDAYITFRYARNLAEGLGLVYNPTEWVLGTTTPLWAIVLAAGYRLGFTDLPTLATWLAALCDAGSAAMLVLLGLRMGWPLLGAALVGLAWALNPMSVAFATGGMESSLFAFWTLGVLTLSARGTRPSVVGGLAGVSVLIRPEGILLVAVVIGWTWWTHRGEALAAAFAAVAPLALTGFILFVLYGSPLPHSIAAKQVAYRPAWPLENALALLVQAGLPGWSTYLLAVLPAAAGVVLAAVGLVGMVELTRRGLIRLGRERTPTPWQPFAAFAALYVAFYVVVGLRGVRLFPWYLVPIEPFYLLGAAAGLSSLPRFRGAWLAAILVIWQLPAIDWHQPLRPIGEDLTREQLLLDVGRGLVASLRPNATIAAPEIGALGYASNLRVLDTVGLVSPDALQYYPLPIDQVFADNAIPAGLIADQQPDVVVTLDAYARGTLLRDTRFQHDYALEHAYPAVVWQSEALLVFRRVDLLADR